VAKSYMIFHVGFDFTFVVSNSTNPGEGDCKMLDLTRSSYKPSFKLFCI
jgi:hypothetical protein